MKIMLKLFMSDFNAFAVLLLLYNHGMQVVAMIRRARDIFFFAIVKSLVLIFEMCCLHNNIFPQLFPDYL